LLLLDIGANRGDVVEVALKKGFDQIIAVEAAPKVFKELIKKYIYNDKVIPLNFAVSDTNDNQIEFYECVEDGLSTIEKSWLTDPSMPYFNKEFRTIGVNTITIDRIVEQYGTPDLIKIDVEGAETQVFNGMTKYHGELCFEWTLETLDKHIEQLNYLKTLGYKQFALQFIETHLNRAKKWYPIDYAIGLEIAVNNGKDNWENGGWKEFGLRPTADVGMIWVV
jgi:FkbM family methyltransferase